MHMPTHTRHPGERAVCGACSAGGAPSRWAAMCIQHTNAPFAVHCSKLNFTTPETYNESPTTHQNQIFTFPFPPHHTKNIKNLSPPAQCPRLSWQNHPPPRHTAHSRRDLFFRSSLLNRYQHRFPLPLSRPPRRSLCFRVVVLLKISLLQRVVAPFALPCSTAVCGDMLRHCVS